jgi:diguanylate cyclase
MADAMDLPDGQRPDTMAIARAALTRIKSHGQAVDPKSYELWYRFAAGDSGLLCAAVNSRLDRVGKLNAKDVDEIYRAHISPTDASTKIDELSARMADEIAQAVAMAEAAENSASRYSANLAEVAKRLATVKDRDGVRAIVASLVRATGEMETGNRERYGRLQALGDEIGRLRRNLKTIRTESATDALTALGNRSFFDAALEKSVAECQAENAPLTLLLLDIDHFRQINDKFGHIVGDQVLRFVANALKEAITGRDIAARYGGEEFAVIMPGTPLRAAIEIANQVRLAVMKAELIRRSTGEKQMRVTVSTGVAALQRGTSPRALIEAAEVCLRAAKRSGGNNVVGEGDDRLC